MTPPGGVQSTAPSRRRMATTAATMPPSARSSNVPGSGRVGCGVPANALHADKAVTSATIRRTIFSSCYLRRFLTTMTTAATAPAPSSARLPGSGNGMALGPAKAAEALVYVTAKAIQRAVMALLPAYASGAPLHRLDAVGERGARAAPDAQALDSTRDLKRDAVRV